jgi:predicted aldo/keto reductase-like oxidoreductase
MMQYRNLGAKGPAVPVLGFGCMRLPVIDGDEGKINEPAATELIHSAIEQGVTYLDTAYPYHQGQSEPWLGRALQGGYRDRIHLATKLPSWAIESRADCDRYLNEQLARLQTDHIDFYLLHCLKKDWWGKLKEVGVLEFLDTALKDGRIRHAGFSFHDDYPLFEEIVDAYPWSFCQVQFNFMDEGIQAGIRGVRYAAAHGLGVIAMEPLRGGHLARLKPSTEAGSPLHDLTARDRIELAFRWVLNHAEITMALTSMDSPHQLEHNLAWASRIQANSMTRDELLRVQAIRKFIHERARTGCTACGYCLPCPQGVEIPRILGFYDDRFIYNDLKGAVNAYNVLVSKNQKADNCTECGDCLTVCPQSLPITQLLKDAHLELSSPPANS